MNSTTTLLIAAAVLVTCLGALGLHMYGDGTAVPRAEAYERELTKVPFQVQVQTSLPRSNYDLTKQQERGIRKFLHAHKQDVKLCVLKVMPGPRGYIFSDEKPDEDRILISISVMFNNGQSFTTKPRPCVRRNIGNKGLRHLSEAWNRYQKIRKAEDFAYKGARKIVDL